jgi:hypothetical protein
MLLYCLNMDVYLCCCLQECVTVECSANCHRVPDGDIYHTQCIKKYISAGAKGTTSK